MVASFEHLAAPEAVGALVDRGAEGVEAACFCCIEQFDSGRVFEQSHRVPVERVEELDDASTLFLPSSDAYTVCATPAGTFSGAF